MDVLTSQQRSYNMSQIRGRDTGPEMILRSRLWSLGLRYRTHYKLPGRPDIVFVSKKIAVFVDGCFWHGCPEHGVRPKTNSSFWNTKIEGTIERDKKNRQRLEEQGWKVLRFWEHDIEKDLAKIARIINRNVAGKRKSF
jgi:DNA mismatch endonuclease (patch repair protein)